MPRTRTRPWLLLLLAAAMAVLLGTAQVAAQQATPAATPEAPTVTREILATGNPAAAPGEALQLVQYTIPGNITLPKHIHPGMQVSTIASGTLLYTVVEGEAYVTRAGTGEQETITPESGETPIEPGDSLVEPAGMVHYGRNGADEPIVIITASLFEADAPPSTLVTPAATPAG